MNYICIILYIFFSAQQKMCHYILNVFDCLSHSCHQTADQSTLKPATGYKNQHLIVPDKHYGKFR